jgi:cyanophycin synthetase
MLYPPGTEATIPIIAVTGTNGKTTTVRLIAHLFRNTGHRVGFTTTDGVYIHNRLVMEGDMTGPFAANIILSNPSIDVAVLETARGGILRSGLGFDECDVGVVLNVSADHLGLRGIHTLEQLAEVKASCRLSCGARGTPCSTADDPRVYAMRDRTVLTSCSSRRRRRARTSCRGSRERARESWRDRGRTIHDPRGRLKIPIASSAKFRSCSAAPRKFQRQNCLAAIASAYVQGMRYDDIRAGLLSFFPSPALTPGRSI